jgi:hypothetical protein
LKNTFPFSSLKVQFTKFSTFAIKILSPSGSESFAKTSISIGIFFKVSKLSSIAKGFIFLFGVLHQFQGLDGIIGGVGGTIGGIDGGTGGVGGI